MLRAKKNTRLLGSVEVAAELASVTVAAGAVMVAASPSTFPIASTRISFSEI
jgi:hypothetical protein